MDHGEKLDIFIQEFKEFRQESKLQREANNDQLRKIFDQTIKTNGRVTSLEVDMKDAFTNIEDLQADKNQKKGRDKVIVFFIVLLTTALGWLLGQILTVKPH